MSQFTVPARALLASERVGHLATTNPDGQPHVIPVCYACDDDRIYIALDAKPKRVAPERLQRVRNILARPQVAFVVDRYDEDWSRLAYVMVQGNAALLDVATDAHDLALPLLRDRYPQYRTMPIDLNPIIAITPSHVIHWQAS